MTHPARCAQALALLVAGLVVACAPPSVPPTLTLFGDVDTAPADGLASVSLSAAVSDAAGAPVDAVVAFALEGPGLLATTQTATDGGRLDTLLYAPFELDLGQSDTVTSTVTARVVGLDAALTDGVAPPAASHTVTFTFPQDGPPLLSARAALDRMPAGAGGAFVVTVRGARVVGDVSVRVDNAAFVVPASLALSPGPRGEATFEVPVPATPQQATITVSAPGAAPAVLELRAVGDGQAAFDLNGSFAQISYGSVRIGDLIFLNPNPQCVTAPTLSLVSIAHDGQDLTLTTEACAITMPSVNVHLVGRSDTWVEDSFIRAANAQAPGPLQLLIPDVSQSTASFDADPAAIGSPLIVGAELASASEALPTEASDARVRDHDGDGNPGVTIHNDSQGAQHTLYRTRTLSMSVDIQGSDVVAGRTLNVTESVLLNGGGISPTVTDLPSPFAMLRVDGRNGATDIRGRDGDASSVSCADVLSFEAELKALFPAPDLTQVSGCPD